MSGAQLKKYVTQTPFEPFRLAMDDGTTYDVPGPEFFKVGAEVSLFFVPSLDDPDLLDYAVRLSNDHISQTWPLKAARERDRAAAPPAAPAG